MRPGPAVPDDLVVMGQVLAPWGVRGWVKVRPYTEATGALVDYATWWLRPAHAGGWQPKARLDARVHADTVVARLAGSETREAALAMKGFEVAVRRAELPAAAASEIYQADLVGLAVVNREGVALGTVAAVVEHGAHPLLVVAPADGGRGAQRLIPYVPAHVDGVDLAARRIDVDWGADF